MSRADIQSLRAYLENLKQKYIQPLERELSRLEDIAKGAQQAVSYLDYSSMISNLAVLAKDHYKTGQNIYIATVGVPDLWVYGILEEFSPYLYLNDEQIVLEIASKGYVDIGWYRLSQLETGKVDLSEYVKFTDYATESKAGVVKTKDEFGINMAGDTLYLIPAYDGEITSQSAVNYRPLMPRHISKIVKVGVTANTETLTDEEKEAVANWLASEDIKKYQLVSRSSAGHIAVPLTPNASYMATSKYYVDNNFVAKPTDTSGFNRVIGINNGSTTTAYYNLLAPAQFGSENDAKRRSGIAYYSGGRLGCAPPERDYEATNKKYVDDLIAELRAEIVALKGV